jgi:hypothetical protein
MYGEGEVHTGFLVGKAEGRRPLERSRVDGKIILKWILEKWFGGMDWIDVANDRDRWRALVNTVMNAGGSIKCGEFLD